jgi:hypothetical protein
LSAYDGARFPINGGPTFTEEYFPEAFATGWRLENLAEGVWKAFAAVAGVSADDDLEIPMQYFCNLVRRILKAFGPGAGPDPNITEQNARGSDHPYRISQLQTVSSALIVFDERLGTSESNLATVCWRNSKIRRYESLVSLNSKLLLWNFIRGRSLTEFYETQPDAERVFELGMQPFSRRFFLKLTALKSTQLAQAFVSYSRSAWGVFGALRFERVRSAC